MRVDKRFVSLLLVAIFAVVAVISVPAMGRADDRKTFKLRVVAGHPLSKGTYWIQSIDEFFIKEVEKRVLERTDQYKVDFDAFYGGSVAKLGEALETIESGLADIAYVLPLTEMAKINPYNFTFWVPFSTADTDKVARSYIRTINEFAIFDEMLAKYNQQRLGDGYVIFESYQIVSNVPIKSIEDLKGVKLAHAGSFLPLIAALGATPVQAVFNEIYTSMDTGIFNGFTMGAASAVGYKIHEVGKHLIKLDLGSMAAGVLTINSKTMQKLPKEIQEILIEVGSEYTWDVIRRGKIAENKALDIMKNAGVEIYQMPAAERTRWANTVNDAGILTNSIRDCKGQKQPCPEIVEFYVKALAEEGYQLPYKPKLQ